MQDTTELEIKIAHLEKTQQELSDAFYLQQKNIEQITLQLKIISDQLKSLRDVAGTDTVDTPPPHY